MSFYIDAWLDRPNPYVQVINKLNSEVIARFSKTELNQAVERGDFCLCDFYDSQPHNQQELVKHLLLIRCCENMTREIEASYQQAMTCRRAKMASLPSQDDQHSKLSRLPITPLARDDIT